MSNTERHQSIQSGPEFNHTWTDKPSSKPDINNKLNTRCRTLNDTSAFNLGQDLVKHGPIIPVQTRQCPPTQLESVFKSKTTGTNPVMTRGQTLKSMNQTRWDQNKGKPPLVLQQHKEIALNCSVSTKRLLQKQRIQCHCQRSHG